MALILSFSTTSARTEMETPFGIIYAEASWANNHAYGEHGAPSGPMSGGLYINDSPDWDDACGVVQGEEVPAECQTETPGSYECGAKARALTSFMLGAYTVSDYAWNC